MQQIITDTATAACAVSSIKQKQTTGSKMCFKQMQVADLSSRGRSEETHSVLSNFSALDAGMWSASPARINHSSIAISDH